MRIRFQSLALLAGLVVLAAACGSSDQATESDPDLAFVEEPAQEAAPIATFEPADLAFELDEDEEALVAFEADWVCAVQNRTFDSNGAISSALEDRLASAGIDEQTYGEFRESINQDENLRIAIMSSYQAGCSID